MASNKDFTDLDKEGKLKVLEELLQKEKSIDSLVSVLGINELEIMGYVSELRNRGIHISYCEMDSKGYLFRNDYPDLSNENTLHIKEDLDSTTKIAAITDLHFGSKCEQLQILNDLYHKFANDGVKYVLVGGNLIEGKYSKKKFLEFGNSLITNDPKAQADHLIEYFPKVDGITTLFITGKNEHSSSKGINIGEYIAQQRDDMKYLGPKSATININNVSVKLEQLKNGDAYTLAYPPQKYARSMASYEDYDIVLLSGTRSAQDFPELRDMRMFAIPSVVARTPLMRDHSIQNTIGAWEFDITYDKKGKLSRLVSNMIPYYVPIKESYQTVKPLNLKMDDNGVLISKNERITNKHECFSEIDKIYKSLKKEESLLDASKRLGYSLEEMNGIITIMQEYGRTVSLETLDNGEVIIQKTQQRRKDIVVKPPKEELTKKSFLVVSDTHYGSIWCQPSMVNTAAYIAYNRGIEDILHIGDIVDGDYSRLRPNHIREVFLYGATGQLDYAIETLPKYKGMKWHVICGSHDQTHLFNYGVNIGEELAKARDDIEYLGQDRGFIKFDNCLIECFHPGGGTSRILSTKPQNGIDQLPSKTKPNMSLRGHYHKVYYMLYRNIHTFLCPCNVDQSNFMMKNEIPNLMGDYIITIWYDELGHIQYLENEPIIFTQEDVRVNDWENPRKYIRSKIDKK